MSALSFLENKLPSALAYLIREEKDTEELRMSIGAPVTLKTLYGKRYSSILCTRALLDETVAKLTEYSFYNHAETVKDGYLSLPHGIRAGICGSALCKNGTITAIKDISFLNLRIPGTVKNTSIPLYDQLKRERFTSGALLYSLPGVGKTTVLKDLIRLLSESGLSLAVIDERGELCAGSTPVDTAVYRYYPKADAIMMAVKTAGPQMLILDEISALEQNAIICAASCGVPVVASTHAGTVEELLFRKSFEQLFHQGVFPILAGLSRAGGTMHYRFSKPAHTK